MGGRNKINRVYRIIQQSTYKISMIDVIRLQRFELKEIKDRKLFYMSLRTALVCS